jgi:hypothetical protein
MVIQQRMAGNSFFFYHAFASIQPANRSDFFNTHRPLHNFAPFVRSSAITLKTPATA